MIHYLITNRQILKDETGKEYIRTDGKEQATDDLRFATYNSETEEIIVLPDMSPSKYIADPKEPASYKNPYRSDYDNVKMSSLKGSERMFTDLYKKMSSEDGGDVLLYVHGFHNDFGRVIRSIKRLEELYIKNEASTVKHLVVFTWPARDSLMRYRDDARDAELSGFALGRAYQMLIDFFIAIFGKNPMDPINQPCNNKIHLLCHSMGNRVLENMVTKLFSDQRRPTALFKEVILTGADIDWTSLEEPRPLYSITEICERVTVYFHSNDNALLISQTTKNPYNRLGRYGARDLRKLPSHVYVVDVSGIKDEKPFMDKMVHHWYYVESKNVVADSLLVLKGVEGESAEFRRTRLNQYYFRLENS
ncbi:MAG TPA: alpha/beta hydrolase [Chitinophagaceae bacterium]|nr:alpha/beta hydrolase [Chitinophagaceae bacterium]